MSPIVESPAAQKPLLVEVEKIAGTHLFAEDITDFKTHIMQIIRSESTKIGGEKPKIILDFKNVRSMHQGYINVLSAIQRVYKDFVIIRAAGDIMQHLPNMNLTDHFRFADSVEQATEILSRGYPSPSPGF